MSTKKTISIDDLLRDSALTIVQLREGSTIPSISKLYQTCKQQVITVRETLHEEQYSQDVIDDISYALCALLDETVLLRHRDSAEQADYHEWLGAPLQVVFFNSNNAGHTLFEKIRQRLKADKKELLVLNCFDRILGLGFQGSYLDKPQMEREHLIIALREAINYQPLPQGYPIIEQNKTYRYWGRKSLLIGTTILAVVGVVAIYLLLDQQLNELITPLLNVVNKG